MAAGAYPAGPAAGAGTAGGGYAPPSGPSSRAAVRVLLRIKPTAAFEDSGLTVEPDGQARASQMRRGAPGIRPALERTRKRLCSLRMRLCAAPCDAR